MTDLVVGVTETQLVYEGGPSWQLVIEETELELSHEAAPVQQIAVEQQAFQFVAVAEQGPPGPDPGYTNEQIEALKGGVLSDRDTLKKLSDAIDSGIRVIFASLRGVSPSAAPSSNRVALKAILDDVATHGGHVVIDERCRVDATILINAPSAAFTVEWRGPNAWLEGDFTANQNLLEIRSAVQPITFINMRLDCRYGATGFGGHGLVLYKCSNVHAMGRTEIRNWKNSAVNTYTDNTDPLIGTYENNVFDDVYCISEAENANNGFITVNMRKSGAHFVYVRGVNGSPGAAIGIKNKNEQCFIGGYVVENCRDAVIFGQDQGDGSDYCYVGQGVVRNCRTPLTFGPNANHNQIGFMLVDAVNRVDAEYPIRSEGGSYNTVEGMQINNLPIGKTIIWLWPAATGNKIKVSGSFNTGSYATVEGTYNQITFECDLDETGSFAIADRVIDLSGGNTNTYIVSHSQRGPQWTIGRVPVSLPSNSVGVFGSNGDSLLNVVTGKSNADTGGYAGYGFGNLDNATAARFTFRFDLGQFIWHINGIAQVRLGTSGLRPETAGLLPLGAAVAPWSNVYSQKFTLNAVQWSSGTGSPEGVVAAPVGSLYSRTDGGAGSTFYVKESGTGNTGWVAK